MKLQTVLQRALLAAVPLTLCASLLSSCGGDTPEDERPPNEEVGTSIKLSIRANDGRGTVKTATLECGGNGPQARGLPGRKSAELCALARRLGPFLARAPDPARVCTQIYGGSETARIRGTIEGRGVDRRFSRTDGCKISDWERVAGLLPIEATGANRSGG